MQMHVPGVSGAPPDPAGFPSGSRGHKSTEYVAGNESFRLVSRGRCGSVAAIFGMQFACDFLHEGVCVFEMSIDRGKPHVCDLVDFLQCVHDHFTNDAGANFILRQEGESDRDVSDDSIEDFRADVAFPSSMPGEFPRATCWG